MKKLLVLLCAALSLSAQAQVTLFSPFMGTWENTNRGTREIVRLELFEAGGQEKVHMWFSASPALFDAGIHDITLHRPTAPRGARATGTLLRWQGTLSTQTLELLIEEGSGDTLDATLIRVAGNNAGTFERMSFRKYVPREDCLRYNPASIRLIGSTIAAGNDALMAFSDPRDRELGLALARAYAAICTIGRDNPRPDRNKYILEYWSGGENGRTAPTHDCIPYDPARLRVTNAGAEGYRVESAQGGGWNYMHLFHSAADAEAALAVFRRYSQQCFIGRGSAQVHHYLK